jgi:hypothetical protein
MKEFRINLNDPDHSEKEDIKAEVSKLNAQAVVKKLQDFEERLSKQDILINLLQSQLRSLEGRLNVQMNLEAMASKMGNGPTS